MSFFKRFFDKNDALDKKKEESNHGNKDMLLHIRSNFCKMNTPDLANIVSTKDSKMWTQEALEIAEQVLNSRKSKLNEIEILKKDKNIKALYDIIASDKNEITEYERNIAEKAFD